MSQLTHKYINRIPEREENLFLEEYYSGTDTKVYIDNEEQTEIAYISYSVSEQLKPLYGYASRTWDDVAVGTRIVTGAFKVSVRNPEEQSTYEEVVLHQIVEKEPSTQEEINDKNKQEEEKKQEQEWIDDDNSDDDTDNTENKEETTTFSQEVKNYQIKLQTLGYTIITADGLLDENGEVMGLTAAALLEFCTDHGVVPARKFTTAIKKAIDEALGKEELTPSKLNTDAIIRSGPGEEYGMVTTLKAGTKVFLIGKQDKWINIKTESGITGYTRAIFIM